MGDVDHERDIRLQRISGHGRAIESVFLLHGGDGGHADFRRLGGELTQGFTGGPHADAVVTAAGGHALVLQALEAIGVGDGIPHPRELFGLGFRAGADVDIHLVEVGNFFAVVRLLQMNGQRSGHPGDGALRTVDVDALPAEKRAVDAADSLDEKKTILIEVRDHEAQFIDVPGQHNVRSFALLAQPRESIAVSIGGQLVAVRFDVIRPHPLSPRLEPGGRRCDDELFEEFERCFVHHDTMQTVDSGGKASTTKSASGRLCCPA